MPLEAKRLFFFFLNCIDWKCRLCWQGRMIRNCLSPCHSGRFIPLIFSRSFWTWICSFKVPAKPLPGSALAPRVLSGNSACSLPFPQQLTNPLTNGAPRKDACRAPRSCYSAFKRHLNIAPLQPKHKHLLFWLHHVGFLCARSNTHHFGLLKALVVVSMLWELAPTKS